MEFWLAFIVTFIIGSIYSFGKRTKEKEQGHKHATHTKPDATTEHQQNLRKADEELITVILPTINKE